MKTLLLIFISSFLLISNNIVETTNSCQRREIKIENRKIRLRSQIIPPIQAFIDGYDLTVEFVQPTPLASVQITHIETGDIIYCNDFINPQIITIDLLNENKGSYELEIIVEDDYYIGYFETSY